MHRPSALHHALGVHFPTAGVVNAQGRADGADQDVVIVRHRMSFPFIFVSMENEQKTSQRPLPWLLIVAVASAAVALVIDMIDGQASKTLGTLGLLLGLVGLLAQRMTQRYVFHYVTIAGLLLFALSTAYRAAVHQGWL